MAFERLTVNVVYYAELSENRKGSIWVIKFSSSTDDTDLQDQGPKENSRHQSVEEKNACFTVRDI